MQAAAFVRSCFLFSVATVIALLCRSAGAEPDPPSPAPLPAEFTDEEAVTGSHAVPRNHGPFGFDDRPWSVNAMIGFATPVGLGGGVVELSPLPALAFGVGAGTNLEGLQLAALVRLRPLYWETRERAFAIALSAALAEGPYSSKDDLATSVGDLMGMPNAHYAWLDHALWFQPELQFEYEARSGFHLVVTGLGGAFLLNGDSAQCKTVQRSPGVTYDEAAGCAMNRGVATVTVEVGYALP